MALLIPTIAPITMRKMFSPEANITNPASGEFAGRGKETAYKCWNMRLSVGTWQITPFLMWKMVRAKALDVLVEIAFPHKRNHRSLQLLYQDSSFEEELRNPKTRRDQ